MKGNQMALKSKKNYTHAVGKRKSSSARVRLFKGTEENTVNGQLVGKYFPGEKALVAWQKPFELLNLSGKYYFTARIVGGGKQGQLDALVFAISRAFSKSNDDHKKPLKKAKLLTRDSRIRERRKMGMGGKARRKKQSPKR
jgi:small subunit ribosomal protein S9